MPKNHSHSQGSFCHNFVIIIIVIHALIIFINKSIFVTHQKFSKPIFHPWRFTTAARTTQLQIVGKDPLHLFIRTVVILSYFDSIPHIPDLPTSGPQIYGLNPSYRLGETLNLTCESGAGKVLLQWCGDWNHYFWWFINQKYLKRIKK